MSEEARRCEKLAAICEDAHGDNSQHTAHQGADQAEQRQTEMEGARSMGMWEGGGGVSVTIVVGVVCFGDTGMVLE